MDYDFDQIKELSGLFFSPTEIAIMMEYPIGHFREQSKDQGSKVYRALLSGRLQSQIDFRKSIKTLAIQGSAPAQTHLLTLISDLTSKLIDDE